MLRGKRGYTLLELLVVVSAISTLASIAMPKYANLVQKAQEGSLKGVLGSIRSALNIYYADNQGISPGCLLGANSDVFSTTLVPRYISGIGIVKNNLHPPTNSVYCDSAMVPGSIHDGQGWYYDGVSPADGLVGGVWVACDHTDSAGNEWTTY